MDREFSITNDKDYHEMMIAIYELMNKGEKALLPDEIERLAAMSSAAEKYEDEVLHIKPVRIPNTLPEVIELFMYENKLTRAKLADKLGVDRPKLSQIMNGKRKPDVPFLKALYSKLHIDPKIILEHV